MPPLPDQIQQRPGHPRSSPSLYSAQLRTWYFFCFACLYWQRLGYFMLEHTSATTIGGFRSQPERCNNASLKCEHTRFRLGNRESWGHADIDSLVDVAGCRQHQPGLLLPHELSAKNPDALMVLVCWFSVKMTARLDVNATPGVRMSPLAPGIVPECSGASRVKRVARAGFAALDSPCALWYSLVVGERCFRHQVLLRRQGHFYNRGSRPTCAGERHRVGLY